MVRFEGLPGEFCQHNLGHVDVCLMDGTKPAPSRGCAVPRPRTRARRSSGAAYLPGPAGANTEMSTALPIAW